MLELLYLCRVTLLSFLLFTWLLIFAHDLSRLFFLSLFGLWYNVRGRV
jgi:hypothetical protein